MDFAKQIININDGNLITRYLLPECNDDARVRRTVHTFETPIENAPVRFFIFSLINSHGYGMAGMGWDAAHIDTVRLPPPPSIAINTFLPPSGHELFLFLLLVTRVPSMHLNAHLRAAI